MASSKRKDNRGRILKTGESQRKDKTYMYRWTDQQKQRHCIYDNTLEGLRKQEEQIQLDILQGIKRDNVTLNQMIERYFSTKSSLASSTYENYLYYYNHSIKNDVIGMTKVTNIRKSDLLLYFSKKSNEDGYSNGTIHILNKIIHPALQLAVDDDIIRKNPADGCMKEYQQDSEIKYALSLEEENEFLQRIQVRPRMKRYYPFFAIMLYTGIRISDADGKISLNQQKPSKHAGLRRFGPEKFLQRNNEFMKERPIFYKKPIKTEKDFSTWLRCFYYTTKAVITEYTYF